MRLIKLSANHESFKTVNFRPYGITLVVGSQSKSGETYNGVGKSLIIQLVNFCLGARANEQFAEKLKTWEFTLEFDLDGTHHTVARGTQSQNTMRLNEADMTLKAFNLWMGERAFAIPDEIAGMSFRSLLPKFLRRGNAEYVKPLHTGEATDLAEILHNAFLLGLEAALVTRKAALRKEITRIAVLRKNFKVDDLLKDFSSGGKDPFELLGSAYSSSGERQSRIRSCRELSRTQEICRRAFRANCAGYKHIIFATRYC
jgi:uncharacterized protein YydD (DUF2326 family)